LNYSTYKKGIAFVPLYQTFANPEGIDKGPKWVVVEKEKRGVKI
jgi:hypothetical protein